MIAVWIIALLFLGIAVRSYIVRRGIAQYSPVQVDEKLGEGRGAPLLLDVRTEKERVLGSIPGSIHIPINELAKREHELKRHVHREIICYCHSGNRSLRAAHLLKTMGYKTGNLKGGIAEWNFLHRNDLTKKRRH